MVIFDLGLGFGQLGVGVTEIGKEIDEGERGDR